MESELIESDSSQEVEAQEYEGTTALINIITEKNRRSNEPFVYEDFMNNLCFDASTQLSDKAIEQLLQPMDSLDMLEALQQITVEVGQLHLENILLIDYLEKNDPTSLSIVRNRRNTLDSKDRAAYGSTTSFGTIRSRKGRKQIDPDVSYDLKIQLAEKAATEIEKRLKQREVVAKRERKFINAQIEELNMSIADAEETEDNFDLHFLRATKDLEFLESAGEKELDQKFQKFVINWLKDGRALMATMRMLINNISDKCRTLESALVVKSDLAYLLKPVDFEQMIIKHSHMMRQLEDKSAHLHGLKGVTGRASIVMSHVKKKMTQQELELKRAEDKCADSVKSIARLERELDLVKASNSKDRAELKQLQGAMENFEAPSVNQYRDVKDEVTNVDKEQKNVDRKSNVLNMKLVNLINKKRRQTSAV